MENSIGLRYWSLSSELDPRWCKSDLDVIAHPRGVNGFAQLKCGELSAQFGNIPTDLKIVIGKQTIGQCFG